jgi:DNA-binding transcriptional LysR family regulator
VNSIRHLELIVALATHRHFGRAAEALGISQPAITKGLNHLEKALGVKLFDRAGTIAPTIFGEIVLARSETIVEGFKELLREIHLAKGMDTGQLSVSAGLYPAEVSAQEAIGCLSSAHPSIVCDLMVKDWPSVVEDVLKGRCDLGFADITEAAKHSELQTELVRKCPLLVICRPGHPLARLTRLTLEDMFEFPWAGVMIPNAVQAHLPKEPRPYGVVDQASGHGSPRLKVETFTGIRRIVANSDALSAAPDVLLTDHKKEGRLVVLPVDLPWLGLNYGFIWRRGRSLSPAAMEFKAMVRKIEAQATEWLATTSPVAR